MKTAFQDWKTDRLQHITPEEFFGLIRRNAQHIRKGFPVTLERCSNFEKTIQFLGENIEKEEKGEGFYFYLRNTATGSLIGYVCIKNISKTASKCELAYFVDKDFEGRGIITKAVSGIISFCFGELGMNKVFICTSQENTASQRIALKHGFTNEGLLRQEFKNGDGVFEDVLYFGLLKSEFTHER